VRRVASLTDAANLGEEVAVVGIGRGCDPFVSEALFSSMEAAAAADTLGLKWYFVSNDTPGNVVRALESRVHLEVPTAAHDSDTLPVVVVLDRMGKKGCKYLMPLSNFGDDFAAESTPNLDVLSLVPFPSQISNFTSKVVSGSLSPTLLGEKSTHTPSDGDKTSIVNPFLSEVTSDSWASIVLDPSSDILLEAYLSHCPMCQCLAPRVAMAGEVASRFFPSTASVKVAFMNVDENERPLDWMPSEAFPTIQLFNKSNSSSTITTSRPANFFSKMSGPSCASPHVALPVPAVAGGARSTLKGTPPCIPSLDFTHPSVPGKMALPSVKELVFWMAANCSTPFDPTHVKVSSDAVKFTGQASPWSAVFPGVYTSLPQGGPSVSLPAHLPLTTLLEDMDAEARVYEAGVFDAMFSSHVVDLLVQAVGTSPVPYKMALKAMQDAAAGHTEAQAAWIASGKDIRSYNPSSGPQPSLGGLPGFGNDPLWSSSYLPKLNFLANELKKTVSVSSGGGQYGGADAAWGAMDTFSSYSTDVGARAVARKWMNDQEEMRCIAAALPLVSALALLSPVPKANKK